MFTRKKIRPPDTEFVHGPDCKIVVADPGVEIPWSKIERGLWERRCTCSFEYWREPVPEERRADPYDPRTFRHAGECEHRDETDPALLKLILDVKPARAGLTGGSRASPATSPGRRRTRPRRRCRCRRDLGAEGFTHPMKHRGMVCRWSGSGNVRPPRL
jgi:hypothetical protein